MNIIQAINQFQSFLRDLSPVLWDYKEELKKQGFTENQAYTLVRDYQKVLLEQANEIKC